MSTDIPATPIVSRDPVKPLSPADLLTTPSHLDLVNKLMADCNKMLEQGKDSNGLGNRRTRTAVSVVADAKQARRLERLKGGSDGTK